ncbi:hypothetical protein, partial [Escherichia coli]|uniref:hypothetical protein n=1 Tax=Escherichia coli TaxID=562 RepID=UPI001954563A
IILDPALSAGIAAPARTIGSRKWGNVVPSGGIGRSATVAGSYSPPPVRKSRPAAERRSGAAMVIPPI